MENWAVGRGGRPKATCSAPSTFIVVKESPHILRTSSGESMVLVMKVDDSEKLWSENCGGKRGAKIDWQARPFWAK